MPGSFDFISTEDKPALIAFSTPEWLETAKAALIELGYKVHTAATHSDFLVRFTQVHYQVVVIEELFGANTIEENQTLQALQNMPVNQRRHATVILLGDSFQTFMPIEAFKQSVHAVINSSEMFLLKQLVEKAVADNSLFLHSFREVQNRLYTSGSRL
jgi:DNA-binding PucR family transcriptional regulator